MALPSGSPRSLLATAFRLLPLLLAAGQAGVATATPFDGQAVSAPTLGFKGANAVLGAVQVPLADCDSLLLGPGGAAGAAPLPPLVGRTGVWLVDGSWMPADSIAAASGPDSVRVVGPLGEMELPLAAILGWGDHLLAASSDGSDALQVASGAMTGKVQGISDGQLSVLSALTPDKPLALKVADVACLRLAGTPMHRSGIQLSVQLDLDHPPLALLPQDGLPLAAAPTVKVAQALVGRALRVEGGRRSYLSALRPSAVSEQGAFDVTWHWTADTDLEGGPIRLGSVRYARGISVHSKAVLDWALPGPCVRLHAVLGIADLVAPEGDCAVELRADGVSVWSRSSVKGTDKPVPLDIDLHGAKTLELKVDYGARYDIGDHLTLADAWVLRSR